MAVSRIRRRILLLLTGVRGVIRLLQGQNFKQIPKRLSASLINSSLGGIAREGSFHKKVVILWRGWNCTSNEANQARSFFLLTPLTGQVSLSEIRLSDI
jgi:hypothetical protein